MSANTSILEGGNARSFGPVKALMVQGSDGKYYPWYPESDRALGTLSVDKNGVYKASDKGVYGWSRVSVNVPQNEGVTGRDPDTGEDVYVHPDPSGELVKDVLPVEIRVIEPPTNPYGIYVDGQTITKDGMVVKAYGTNGDEMQIVPIGEITINPTVAIYDESTDQGISGTATLDGVTYPIIGKIQGAYSPPPGGVGSAIIGFTSGSGTASVFFTSQQSGTPISIIASQSRSISYEDITIHYGPNIAPYYTQQQRTRNGIAYTRDGKTVYYISPALSDVAAYSAPVVPDYGSVATAAWAIIYGDVEINPAGSLQAITVSWPRPGDGAILETTFDILVGPRGGGGED